MSCIHLDDALPLGDVGMLPAVLIIANSTCHCVHCAKFSMQLRVGSCIDWTAADLQIGDADMAGFNPLSPNNR